jgi:hypothetical protein
MPASTSTSRSAARLAATILLVVLIGGCTGQTGESTTASQAAATSTTSTLAPTTSTVLPMTAEELAWLKAVTTLRKKMEKALGRGSSSGTRIYLTRAKMTSTAAALRTCSRELARIGSPGDRLEPVHALVEKACRTFDKGAKCYATAARVSMADGGVIVGTRAERTQRKALDCGGAAEGDGLNLLIEAEAKGEEIRAKTG